MTPPPHASTIINLLKYLGFLAYSSPEAVDLALDWDFYAEIETELKTAILVFAIFGTITFVLGFRPLHTAHLILPQMTRQQILLQE
jgi:hypothetical protein